MHWGCAYILGQEFLLPEVGTQSPHNLGKVHWLVARKHTRIHSDSLQQNFPDIFYRWLVIIHMLRNVIFFIENKSCSNKILECCLVFFSY